MEVRGRQPGDAHPAQQRFAEARAEAARTTRAKVQQAREVLAQRAQRAQRRDQLELRESVQDVAGGLDARRAERVAELKDEHEAGRLNTPERIERSAHRILSEEAG